MAQKKKTGTKEKLLKEFKKEFVKETYIGGGTFARENQNNTHCGRL